MELGRLCIFTPLILIGCQGNTVVATLQSEGSPAFKSILRFIALF